MALAVLWATDALTVPLMGALAVVGGSLGTLSFPAFQGMLASTVPEEDLESAVAVNSLSLQVARFVGPAIAGVLLATSGPTAVFVVNAVSFLGVLVAVGMLPGSRVAGAVELARRRDEGGPPLRVRPAQHVVADDPDAARRRVRHAADRVHAARAS